MRITDLKCAIIANSPVIRITTDEGITGWSQIETPKPYLQAARAATADWIVGQDPRDVERVMRRIRVRGGFKPFGSAVSAIEHALWDIAGKAAGVPVYRLLGGKVRDQVRTYRTLYQRELGGAEHTPDGYVNWAEYGKSLPGRLHDVQAAHVLPFVDGARLPRTSTTARCSPMRLIPIRTRG